MSEGKEEEPSVFIKYTKMENATERYVVYIQRKGEDGGEWIAEEKAHGSNGSLTIDKDNVVKIGRRTALLSTKEDREKFFESDTILCRYQKQAINVRTDLVKSGQCKHDEKVMIYFEFIGKTSTGKPIQHKVDYCPDLQIYVFGLRIGGKSQSRKVAETALDGHGFVYAPILFRGAFKDVVAWSKEHREDPSDIPALYKHVPDEPFVREGHVLRPFDGPRTNGIKDKGSLFSEVKARKGKKKEFSDDLSEHVKDVQRYITENRLTNVTSKELPFDKKLTGKFIGLLTKDVFEDYEKENPDLLLLSRDERKLFNKEVGGACARLITRTFFLN